MKIHFHLTLCLAALFVSCDKPEDSRTSKSSKESKPVITRSNRPAREKVTNYNEKFRAALEIAMTIDDPPVRDQALADIVRKALKHAPDISVEAFKQLSAESVLKTELLQTCPTLLMQKNPDAAVVWAAALGSEKDVHAANVQIARFLAESDPQRAADLFTATGMEIGKPSGYALALVVRRWASKSPSDAATWAIARPSGDSRKAGIETVFSQWIKTDSQAALSWMEKLSDGAVRREVSRALAEALVSREPITLESVLLAAAPSMRAELEQQVEQITKEAEMEAPEVPADPEIPAVPETPAVPAPRGAP